MYTIDGEPVDECTYRMYQAYLKDSYKEADTYQDAMNDLGD